MKQENFIMKDFVKYYRVSTILDKYNDFSFVDEKVLKEKQQVGTAVHDFIESICCGSIAFSEGRETGYVNSFIKWYEIVKPQYMLMEERFFDDELRITGKIDAIVKIEDSLYLLDYKTCASKSKTWRMQAHFYKYLVEKTNLKISDTMLFLRLDANGGQPFLHTYSFSQNTLNGCKQAARDFLASV